MRQCSIEDCTRPVNTGDLCGMHHKRLIRHGSPYLTKNVPNKGLTCSVNGCTAPALSKGWCQVHYESMTKHGRDYLILGKRGEGYVESRDGYRHIYVDGKKILEHVHLAERALGRPLPHGAVVHHMNKQPADNYTPFNLIICPNQAYHMLLHKRMRLLGYLSNDAEVNRRKVWELSKLSESIAEIEL